MSGGEFLEQVKGCLTGAGAVKSDQIITIGSAAGAPGGKDTDIQFNDAGAFGGNDELFYEKTASTFAFSSTKDGSSGTVSASGVGSAAFLISGENGFVGVDVCSSIPQGMVLAAGETPSGGILIQNNPTDDTGSVILGHGAALQSPDQQLKVDVDGVTIILSNGKNVAMFGDGSTPSSFVFGQTGDKILFFNTGAAPAPSGQLTVTGSKGANAALTSLIAALVAYGLILDTTT